MARSAPDIQGAEPEPPRLPLSLGRGAGAGERESKAGKGRGGKGSSRFSLKNSALYYKLRKCFFFEYKYKYVQSLT